MATLTTDEKAKVQAAIDYMVLSMAHEIPIDAKVVEILTPLSEKFGFPTAQAPQTGLQEALRDRPFSTLLQALLAVSA